MYVCICMFGSKYLWNSIFTRLYVCMSIYIVYKYVHVYMYVYVRQRESRTFSLRVLSLERV